MGGKFKFQVQDSFLEHLFFLEIWRFEKRIALSEKKQPLEAGTYICIFVCHDIHHNCLIVSVKGIYRVEEEKWITLELIGVDFTSIFFN